MRSSVATVAPVRVDRLRFNGSAPQLYRDGWQGTDRVCRYQGKCIGCGRRTYGFDDGEDDPRGPLGDHASCPLTATEYGMTGPDQPCCFLCLNDDEAQYLRTVDRAKRRRDPRTGERVWQPGPGACGVCRGLGRYRQPSTPCLVGGPAPRSIVVQCSACNGRGTVQP